MMLTQHIAHRTWPIFEYISVMFHIVSFVEEQTHTAWQGIRER
jgi:hypothetical protein